MNVRSTNPVVNAGKPSPARIWLGFVIVCLVWGSTWLAIKMGLNSVPPFLSIALRFAVALSIILPVVIIRSIEIPFTPEARKLYLNLIVFSFTIPFALIYWGERYVPSGLASILFTTYPFWVAICSQLMLPAEPLNAFKIAGIVFGFIGSVIIFAGDVAVSDPHSMIAMGGIAVCPCMQAYSLVAVKKWGKPIHPFALNLVGMGASIVPILALSLLVESYATIAWDINAIGSIVFLGVIGSVVVFAIYFWLLKRIEAVYLSLASFITPIISVILGVIVLGERFEMNVLIGAAFVLVGVLVAHGRSVYGRVRAAFE